jgi:hypothetical protein
VSSGGRQPRLPPPQQERPDAEADRRLAPPDDSLLKPGATDAWELKYGFDSTYAAELKYKLLGTDATVTYTIETSTYSNNSACKVTPLSAGNCAAGGTALGFN